MAHDFSRGLRVDNKVFTSQEEYDAFKKEQTGSSDDAVEEIDATGSAKALAEEHGIDLSDVEGTGEDGRILKGDVEALVEGG